MMKKRIKKTIALFGITVMILSSSMTALAASCLDVRDYGYHRYQEKRYEVLNRREVRYVSISEGKIHYVDEIKVHQVCVCGAQKCDTIYRDGYKKIGQ